MAILDFQSKPSGMHQLGIRLGMYSCKHPRRILVIAALITAFLLPYAAFPEYDDDVIQFLPEGDPEVDRFMEIGERFEGLAIGIIGIEPKEGDIFSSSSLRFMRELSDELPQLEGVGFATSITTIPDIAEAQGEDGESMTDLRDMIGRIPEEGTPELATFLKETKQRVLSRDHVRGALVSETGDAAMVLVTFLPNAPVKPTAEKIEAKVREAQARTGNQVEVHLGGAPFIGAFVAGEARKDIGRLSPWVSLAVILILLITAQSVPGTLIALSTVGISICWVIGIMTMLHSPLTLVSSSLPVLMVALGSAYSIHVLTQILSNMDQHNDQRDEAVTKAVTYVAPPVMVAGITTALAFLSFLIMDIAPMRIFGLWMASGTLIAVLLALTVVPAASVLFPLKARSGGRAPSWAQSGLKWIAEGASRRPKFTTGLVVIIIAIASFYTSKVDTHMETRAFFEEDSAPVKAEDFLEEKLGGSLFLQVEIKGDIRDPLVLKQIERFEDAAGAQDGVTGVQSIASTLRLVNLALSGENVLPSQRRRADSLGTLAESDPALRLMVDPSWEHALVPVKLGGFNTKKAGELADKLAVESDVLAGTRLAVSRSLLTPEGTTAELREISSHVVDILKRWGIPSEVSEIAATLQKSKEDGTLGADSMNEVVRRELNGLIGDTDDPYLMLKEGASWKSLVTPCADALSQGNLTEALLASWLTPLADPEELEDKEAFTEAVAAIMEYLNDAAGQVRANALSATLRSVVGEKGNEEVLSQLTRAVSPLLDPVAFVPKSVHRGDHIRKAELTVEVSGYPMIYAGMNRSVYNNQTRSMLLSCALVLLALTWFFRSGWLALAAAIPAGATLLITFGVMGFYEIPMDIGTSMIASIALGVGIDYAVHLLWKYGVPSPEEEEAALSGTLQTTGWGIIINALEVTVGFGLLALGTVVPMQNFGLLTALAMILSAIGTLALTPLLMKGVRRQLRGKKT